MQLYVFAMSKSFRMSKRDPKRSTGVTAIGQHLVNTIDYIHVFLPNSLHA